MESVYSQRIRAGKRRTYFFDVRATRANDYYLTITESRKRFNEDGYDRHKIFLYKEDFNKFLKGLTEAVDHVKTELMPDFDFDAFNHDQPHDDEHGDRSYSGGSSSHSSETPLMTADSAPSTDEEAPSVNDDEKIIPQETETPPTPPITNNNDEEVDKW